MSRSFRPHVAIVGINLTGDAGDRSGITLLEPLQSARCILYSGNLNVKLIREIKNKYPQVAWIGKDEKITTLLELIAKKAREVSSYEGKQLVPMPPDWSENTLKALIGEDTDAPANLAYDILVQLFVESTRVELESIDYSGALDFALITPQSVRRGHSAMAEVYLDDRFEPQLVKLAPADAIAQEAANYRQYIEGQLGWRFYAQMVRDVIFWDLGGVLYCFLDPAGSRLVTFHEYYDKSQDPISILRLCVISTSETWRNFYDRSLPASSTERLGDYYESIFRLSKRIPGFLDQNEQIMHPGHPGVVLNVVRWLGRHMRDSNIISYRLAVTHGDLHSDNLFVDGEHAWVTNFERTGPGHILRDFIEMEVDLFTRLGAGMSADEINTDLQVASQLLVDGFNFESDPDLYRQISHPSILKSHGGHPGAPQDLRRGNRSD